MRARHDEVLVPDVRALLDPHVQEIEPLIIGAGPQGLALTVTHEVCELLGQLEGDVFIEERVAH